MVRIVTAAILLLLVWATIERAPVSVFLVVVAAAVTRALWECYGLLEQRGGRPFKALGLVAGLAVIWSSAGIEPRFEVGFPLAAAVILASVLAMARRAEPREMLQSMSDTLFPLLFVVLGLAFLVRLRGVSGKDGQELLLLLLLCVICADTAAYYVGSRFGQRRLAPSISPNKSWEGALGGLVAGALGACLAHAWFFPGLPLGHALALGALLTLAAIAGDLAESVVKRAAGAKDSSHLLPGHGGLLDRMDSLLFTAPVLYYYYRLFLEHPV